MFQPRNVRKTWELMLAEGLVVEDAYDMLSRLRPEHYHQGPELDDDGSAGSVMVFFYPYGARTLYIKLKIWTDAQGDGGVVMSFHEEGRHG